MRKSAKLCIYAVVIAGVVGGTAGFATTDKAVAVSIDGGQASTIHTGSATVGGALKSAHIDITAHDAVAPAVSAAVRDNSLVVVRKGRLLHLNVDGKKIDVWTTATTVDDALAALGYGSGKTISVSRSNRLALTPTEITLLTPKLVTIKADGKVRRLLTTVTSVRAAITAAGIKLGKHDRVSTSLNGAVKNKEVIVVKRVRLANKAELQQIPFSTTSTDDPNADQGTTQIITAGQSGSVRVTYQLMYIDGKLSGKRTLSSKVLSAPVSQVQKVGTKQAPVATPPTTSGSTSSTGSTGTSTGSSPAPAGDAQAIAQRMVTARGWGGDQFGCLVQLWNRESGWNTQASNPSGAYGIPQALPGSKMASAGGDWQTSAATQITWGLGYIAGGYGNPCGAWAHSQSTGWY